MLKPWQLIKLKQQYGGVYVTKFKNNLYVQRQPTLLEIVQQQDAKNVFELSTEEMFLELVKACMVYPENQKDVPDGQIRQLAEQMLDDIPLTETDVRRKVVEYQSDDNNLFKTIALELWQKISGTTIHEFYDRPFNEVLEMYQTIKLLSELAKNTYEQAQAHINKPNINFVSNNQSDYNVYNDAYEQAQTYSQAQEDTNYITIKPNTNEYIANVYEETKDFLGKDLNDVLAMLQNNTKQ